MLMERPTDFTLNELIRLLDGLGYQMVKSGKTGGSRRRFAHPEYGFITLHEPHPTKVLKRYQIDQIIEYLQIEKSL